VRRHQEPDHTASQSTTWYSGETNCITERRTQLRGTAVKQTASHSDDFNHMVQRGNKPHYTETHSTASYRGETNCITQRRLQQHGTAKKQTASQRRTQLHSTAVKQTASRRDTEAQRTDMLLELPKRSAVPRAFAVLCASVSLRETPLVLPLSFVAIALELPKRSAVPRAFAVLCASVSPRLCVKRPWFCRCRSLLLRWNCPSVPPFQSLRSPLCLRVSASLRETPLVSRCSCCSPWPVRHAHAGCPAESGTHPVKRFGSCT
jgi:hypothetical protein